MNISLKLFIFTCVAFVNISADDTYLLLNDLFTEIRTALNAEIPPNISEMRQQHLYRPQNNKISLGVYEALRSIAKNDELECISRLLCEAAAGGSPGFSGKQIKFDKLSLTKLISYLKLDSSFSSPLLVFGKAALLGVSNRGDPYSCIINYPKCPKDQSRLLHYLNNHRGGFFQYFDKKYQQPINYYNQNQYRPGYYYQKYQKKFKRNKIQFENSNGLYEKLKKKAATDIYAKKYSHSSITFPGEKYKAGNNPMVFPEEKIQSIEGDPRILTKPIRTVPKEKDFYFSSSNRFSKNVKPFFPIRDQFSKLTNFVSDRLPNKFYFPKDTGETSSPYPVRYSPNSFFPIS